MAGAKTSKAFIGLFAISFANFLLTSPIIAFQDRDSEEQLLAVLQSDAPASEKAMTCKKLAILGSSASTSELAKLLPNPELSSWARIALEAIPGAEADQALRNAVGELSGNLLIGTVNSIGVREDANAVDVLVPLLKNPDSEVAAAAAVALGKIGGEQATKALREELENSPEEVISAVAEGLILCGEKFQTAGDLTAAAAIFDQVRGADVPRQRTLEATRGAMLARQDDGIPLLIELLKSSDKAMFSLALSTAREFPGEKIDKVLADYLTLATQERAALVLTAMADRPETIDMPSVVGAAKSGPQVVRLAAIKVLGQLGDRSNLELLLDTALQSDRQLAAAAKQAIVRLDDDGVNSEIAERLKEADGEQYRLLIELVGQRRIPAGEALVDALDHSNPEVRAAALTALGETVTLRELGLIVLQFIDPKYAEDVDEAKKSLRAASIRMPDRDACSATLAEALQDAPSVKKTAILEIISEVGGANALQTLATAAMSDNPDLQDAGSRLLGKWNSVEAAPVLLELAKRAPENKYRIRALRGYIGLVRKFNLPPVKRVEMLRTAFEAATRIEEKKLVLDVLQIHPSQPGLRLATTLMENDEIRDQARSAAGAIADKIGRNDKVKRILSEAGIEN